MTALLDNARDLRRCASFICNVDIRLPNANAFYTLREPFREGEPAARVQVACCSEMV